MATPKRYQLKNKPPPKYAIDDMPREILTGIGEIVCWWGYLQFQLGVIVREAIDIETKDGYLLTLGPAMSSLTAMLVTITSTDHWIKDKQIRDDIDDLTSRIRKRVNHRNDYAHGVFGFSDNTQKTASRHLFSSPAQRLSPGSEPITAQSLAILADEVRGLWDEAQGITRRLKALNKKRPRPGR
jgi:hypothetical protein